MSGRGIFYRHAICIAALVSIASCAVQTRVQAQVFSTPINVSGNSGQSDDVRIALDSSGNINLLWRDDTPGNYDIFFSRFTDGGTTFSVPKNISADAGNSERPQFVVDGGGNIHVLWLDTSPPGWELFYAKSGDGGTTFSSPIMISDNAFVVPFREMAVDGSGNTHIAWRSPSGVLYSTSTDGGSTFSAPKIVSGDSSFALSTQVAVNGGGDVFVVWDPGSHDISFSRSTDGGATFSVPQQLSSSPGNSLLPQIVVDDSDNINVAWLELTGQSISYRRSTDGGLTFSATQSLPADPGPAVFIQPRLAVGDSANVYLAWMDFNHSGGPYIPEVFFGRSNDGGATFTGPQNLSSNAGSSFSPAIVVDGSGSINIVWGDVTPGNGEIFFRRSSDQGATFSATENISANAGSSGGPQIAADDSGFIYVAWSDNTPGNSEIFFSRALSPVAAIQRLIADVIALNLQRGISSSLDAKLEGTLRSLDDARTNNDVAAINTLQAFINEVEAQRGIELSEADANALISAAQDIIAALSP